MKMFYIKAFFLLTFLSANVFALDGGLYYRSSDKYTRSGCSLSINNLGSASSPYYLQTFSCNGVAAVRLTGSSMDNCYPSTVADGFSLHFHSCRSFEIGVPTVGLVNDDFRTWMKTGYSVDGFLDKPVILVEGFDPNNEQDESWYYNRGFNQLVTAGQDLFIVNFNDGSASLDDNAAQVQKIIQEIGRYKAGNYPITVIGYSMGGVIARKALKNMETQGIDHKTSLFISYDAPHLGANIPPSLVSQNEKLINYIDSLAAGYTPSSLSKARRFYNSPAARQMRIGGPEFVAASAQDFPVKLARVAVTSGAVFGQPQANPTYQGQSIASFCVGMKVVALGIELGSFCKDLQYTSTDINGIYYDNAPGSYYTQYVNGVNYSIFDAAVESYRSGSNRFSLYSQSRGNGVAFVTTMSAFGIRVGTQQSSAYDYFSYYSPFDKYIAIDYSTSPCAAYAAQVSRGANADHNVFDGSQLAQVNCAINEYQTMGAPIPNRSFKRY